MVSADLSSDSRYLLDSYRMMARIREFDLAAVVSVGEGLVLGPIHPYVGQEAIAAGVCSQLRTDDLVLSTHRGHGHTLAKGASSFRMMAEIFGRADGYCGGKGGSMHVADFEVGMLGANGVVGANIVIAAGAAQSITFAGDDRVVACFFGDGGLNRGPFLEGLNWAQIFNLPVIYICENNRYSSWARTEQLTAGQPVERARALGIPGVVVDGNDVVAVGEAARDAVAASRSGGGPRFIQADTYRLLGHTGTDPNTSRASEEIAGAWESEPLDRARRRLLQLGVTEDVLDGILTSAREEMRLVCEQAAASPYPDARTAYTDVQDVGNPALEAF